MGDYECSCFLTREFGKYGHDAESSVDLASDYKKKSKEGFSDDLESCIMKVKAQGKDKSSAIAICKDSLKE